MKWLFALFSALALEPGSIYRFTLRSVGREGLEIAAFLSEFEKGNLRCDRNLHVTPE